MRYCEDHNCDENVQNARLRSSAAPRISCLGSRQTSYTLDAYFAWKLIRISLRVTSIP